jgi:hypothetical protein
MRDEDAIAMVVMLVIGVVVLAVYIGLIVLGVTIAKRKNRSPHWMWFAIHPMGLLITLIVMACLPPLRRCPNCGQASSQSARLCGFCGYDHAIAQAYAPPQGAYVPPQRY